MNLIQISFENQGFDPALVKMSKIQCRWKTISTKFSTLIRRENEFSKISTFTHVQRWAFLPIHKTLS